MSKKPLSSAEGVAIVLIVAYIIIRFIFNNPDPNDQYFRVDPNQNTSLGTFLGILTSSIFFISIITLIINSVIAIFEGENNVYPQKVIANIHLRFHFINLIDFNVCKPR